MSVLVLHLDEFRDEIGDRGGILNYYDTLPEYIHEMSSDELIKHINRSGEKSRLIQQSVIKSYLKWLSANYDIDCTDLFYNLSSDLTKDENKIFVGFYNLSEMKTALNDAEFILENNVYADWDSLYAVFYLEWYGIDTKSILSIKLRDVTDDGKIVYVPAENRIVIIDDSSVSDFFTSYKLKTGFKKHENDKREIEYSQDTFIRTSSKKSVNDKTIYNLRGKFVRGCEDIRFAKDRVYESGRMYALYQEEPNLNDELSTKHQDIIESIYHQKLTYTQVSSILRRYNVYKQHILKG